MRFILLVTLPHNIICPAMLLAERQHTQTIRQRGIINLKAQELALLALLLPRRANMHAIAMRPLALLREHVRFAIFLTNQLGG